jgi:6-phosphogluconolactonase
MGRLVVSNQRHIRVFSDPIQLAASVAHQFITTTVALLADRQKMNIVLTGGTIGIGVLTAVNASQDRDRIDWSRVHFWWGDERWLPAHHKDRNDQQAFDALLKHIAVPAKNVHQFPSTDDHLNLTEAAARYAAELTAHAPDSERTPQFDITFLGMGPDGHIASLFPGRKEILEYKTTVIPVRNAPKPPPERLSLTRPVLNSSNHLWLVVAGSDKATVVSQATTASNTSERPVEGIPAANVMGQKSTVFFVDHDAAVMIPASLITIPPAPGFTENSTHTE